MLKLTKQYNINKSIIRLVNAKIAMTFIENTTYLIGLAYIYNPLLYFGNGTFGYSCKLVYLAHSISFINQHYDTPSICQHGSFICCNNRIQEPQYFMLTLQ